MTFKLIFVGETQPKCANIRKKRSIFFFSNVKNMKHNAAKKDKKRRVEFFFCKTKAY